MRSKKIQNRILFIFLFSMVFLFISSVVQAKDWQEISGDHFFVYYKKNKSFAKDVLQMAEKYYVGIARDLGYQRYSQFWLWDKRVKIYIHLDKKSFLKATHQPDWSEGMADYRLKQIVSYSWSEGFIESLLPHEIAHLIFRDFVGFKGEVPLWLDEGVAQWAETEKRGEMKRLALDSYRDNKMLLVDDLMKLNIMHLKKINKVYIRPTLTREGGSGVLFLTPDSLVNAYYLASVSLIGFLIETYGAKRFAEFCQRLRDGGSVVDALRFAYSSRIKNLKGLEVKWREYLEEQM